MSSSTSNSEADSSCGSVMCLPLAMGKMISVVAPPCSRLNRRTEPPMRSSGGIGQKQAKSVPFRFGGEECRAGLEFRFLAQPLSVIVDFQREAGGIPVRADFNCLPGIACGRRVRRIIEQVHQRGAQRGVHADKRCGLRAVAVVSGIVRWGATTATHPALPPSGDQPVAARLPR